MTSPDSNAAAASASAALPADAPRVRLIDVHVRRSPSGQCRVEVVLEAPSGERVSAVREALSSEAADVRLGADATVAALNTVPESAMRFELAGTKTVRAFDQLVVLVLVGVSNAGPARLLGVATNEGEICRAAAISVLNATNRARGSGTRAPGG